MSLRYVIQYGPYRELAPSRWIISITVNIVVAKLGISHAVETCPVGELCSVFGRTPASKGVSQLTRSRDNEVRGVQILCEGHQLDSDCHTVQRHPVLE
jgi:hypothetical protein